MPLPPSPSQPSSSQSHENTRQTLSLPPARAPLSSAVQSRIQAVHPVLPLTDLYYQLSSLSDTLSRTLCETKDFPSLTACLQTATFTNASLLQKTRSALSKFRSAARYNLDDLTQVQSFLDRNSREAAESLLSSRQRSNQSLSKTSHTLALTFESAAEQLQQTLQHAISTQASQKVRVDRIQNSTADAYIQLVRAKDTHAAAQTRLSEANGLYQEAEQKQQAAQRRSTILHAVHLSAVVGTYVATKSPTVALSVTGVGAFATATEADISRAREERAVHLVERNEARDERAAASAEIAQLSEQLRCSRREHNLSQDVLLNIEECIETLRKLSGIMLRVEEFWRDVSTTVESGLSELLKLRGSQDGDCEAVWDGRWKEAVESGGEFWVAVGVVCDRTLGGVERVADGTDRPGSSLELPALRNRNRQNARRILN